MKAGWKRVKLGEVCDVFAGGDAPPDVVKDATAVCKYPVFSNGITHDGLYGFTACPRVKCEAITVSARGTIGVVFRRRVPFFPIVRLITIYPQCAELDSGYLYYQAKSIRFEGDGSAVKQLTVPMISEYEIDLPPLATQKKIAAVLGALDDKIELNRKMNANLEEQAQALFKSWFVDFAPWGGKMPKEWKMGTLGDVAVYYDGSISAGELSPRNYFSTENMVANKGGVVDASSLPQEGCVPECIEGCVLVSNIRPYFKKIHRVLFRGGHSNDVLCFKARDSQFEWFLYQLLLNDAFFDHMMSGAKGTKMPRGDKRQILSYPCHLLSKDAAEEFGKQVSPLCRMMAMNIEESCKLAETRDALLPKLMSGEVEVE